jgi:hypothetical protein
MIQLKTFGRKRNGNKLVRAIGVTKRQLCAVKNNNRILATMTKLNLLLIGLLVAAIGSCDFSTHHYVSYESTDDNDFLTQVGWGMEEKNCSIYTEDTTLIYNKVQLLFYSNQSTVNSYPKPGYEYIYGDTNNLIDSVKIIEYYFDIQVSDNQVTDNDSIGVIFYNGKKIVRTQVLYKETSESEFLDRVPLPKLH